MNTKPEEKKICNICLDGGFTIAPCPHMYTKEEMSGIVEPNITITLSE